jgi:hypothetical protein
VTGTSSSVIITASAAALSQSIPQAIAIRSTTISSATLTTGFIHESISRYAALEQKLAESCRA